MPKTEQTAITKAGGLQVSSVIMSQVAELKTDGFENVGAEDLGVSILSILQAMSPEVDKKTEQFVPGAEEGMFFNSLTKKFYTTLKVVPIGFTKAYIEYIPREKGGGFVGRYSPEHSRISESQAVGNKLITPNGNELVETREHFVMVLPENEAPFIALLPLKSTQIRHSKGWLSEAHGQTITLPDGTLGRLPLFYQTYELGTKVESNAKGSWMALTYKFLGPIDDALVGPVNVAKDGFEATSNRATAAYDVQQGPKDSTVDAVAKSME